MNGTLEWAVGPIVFTHAWALLALLGVPAVVWAYWRRTQDGLSTTLYSNNLPRSMRVRLLRLPPFLRILSLILLIFALAQPVQRNVRTVFTSEGIDLVLVLDLSTSMRAMDVEPNRFEAAKEVARQFIAGRRTDRIGLVVFAAEAYTQAPLTNDYSFLLSMVSSIQMGMVEDGTAIGSGLATAVNRLRDSEASSRVILLLTDGQNNRGSIPPLTAADLAASSDIRVYTIGVGGEGDVPFPTDQRFGPTTRMIRSDVDEPTLREIASRTGGQYFRATDRTTLEAIYAEIDQLERTPVETNTFTQEQPRFAWFAFPALLLLLLERILAAFWLRMFP